VDALKSAVTSVVGQNIAGRHLPGQESSTSSPPRAARVDWDDGGARSIEDAGLKDGGLRGSKNVSKRASLASSQQIIIGSQAPSHGQASKGADRYGSSRQSTVMHGAKSDFLEALASAINSRGEQNLPEGGARARHLSLSTAKGRQSRGTARAWTEQSAIEQETLRPRGRRNEEAVVAMSVAADFGLTGEHRCVC
jgi:hypothetical protein